MMRWLAEVEIATAYPTVSIHKFNIQQSEQRNKNSFHRCMLIHTLLTKFRLARQADFMLTMLSMYGHCNLSLHQSNPVRPKLLVISQHNGSLTAHTAADHARESSYDNLIWDGCLLMETMSPKFLITLLAFRSIVTFSF